MRPPHEKIHSRYANQDGAHDLPGAIDQLLADQKRDWKQLRDGYAALREVRTREIAGEGFVVTLQFNPQRIVSTNARTDEVSIRSRKCFLCPDRLPPEQRGILYGDTFLVLCNPAPIVERHLTIVHVDHRDQEIEGFVTTMLDLARALSPSHTLFYNGPKSGASAPDHMHFQALPANVLPVERDATVNARRMVRRKENSVSLWTLNDYWRQVILLESESPGELEGVFRRLLNAMRKVLKSVEEPLINLLCSYERGRWRIILFPRTKHRPDEFFRQGLERVVVSPAAVDMGGYVVVPLERDFERADAGLVENIFRQVSQDSATVGSILEAL